MQLLLQREMLNEIILILSIAKILDILFSRLVMRPQNLVLTRRKKTDLERLMMNIIHSRMNSLMANTQRKLLECMRR